MIIVRYADDIVVGFEHEDDARRFLEAMRERLSQFALSLHPDKTRLIEFGRFAAANRARRGLGKPETFAFLGFTFICGKSRRGYFLLKRKSRRDRMRAKLRAIKQELRRRRHQPIPVQGKWLGQVVRGWFNYHAVPTNSRTLGAFRFLVIGPLAANAPAAQPEGRHDLGADHAPGGRLAAQTENPPPLAATALRRQTPEVGAVCPNWARTDLCGGRSAMSVPTAIFLVTNVLFQGVARDVASHLSASAASRPSPRSPLASAADRAGVQPTAPSGDPSKNSYLSQENVLYAGK